MHPLFVLKKDRNELWIYSLDEPVFLFSTVPIVQLDLALILGGSKSGFLHAKKTGQSSSDGRPVFIFQVQFGSSFWN